MLRKRSMRASDFHTPRFRRNRRRGLHEIRVFLRSSASDQCVMQFAKSAPFHVRRSWRRCLQREGRKRYGSEQRRTRPHPHGAAPNRFYRLVTFNRTDWPRAIPRGRHAHLLRGGVFAKDRIFHLLSTRQQAAVRQRQLRQLHGVDLFEPLEPRFCRCGASRPERPRTGKG